MAPANHNNPRPDNGLIHQEEEQGLLSTHSSDEDEGRHDAVPATQRQPSSLSILSPRSPRTSNRVRFDLPSIDQTTPTHGPPPYDDVHYNEDDEVLLSGRRTSLRTTPLALDEDTEGLFAHLMRPKSSLRSAMSNMANSIIGAGIIGQPYALRQAGFLTGVTLLIGLTFVIDWTIRLIVINSKLSGRDSFQGTVEHCFGKPGLIAISFAQWAFAFGGMVAFGVIVGDSIPHVLVAVLPALPDVPVIGLLANRRVIIFLLIMGISWPLSLYRDISKLAKASTLALISMLIILVTVVTQGVTVPAESRGTFSLGDWTLNSGVFQAIGVISFAFVCHHNSLLIYGSLSTPTIDRFTIVTHVSTAISLLACLTMALSGFLTFGSLTQGNVLNNFPTDNVLVNIARLCFGLNMLTTLPLEAFVCREVMFHYWYDGDLLNVPLPVHVAVSTALVASSMMISLMVCDLGAIFELIGATSACVLAYILPPLCYIKLSKGMPFRTKVAAYGCVAFGCAVLGISLVQAIIKIINSDGSSAKCQ